MNWGCVTGASRAAGRLLETVSEQSLGDVLMPMR